MTIVMQPQTFLISKINNKKQKYISHWKQNKYSPVFTGLSTSNPVQNRNAINLVWLTPIKGFAGDLVVKNLHASRRYGFAPWIRKILWRGKLQSSPIFLPGKSHGQRSWQTIVQRISKSRTWLTEWQLLSTSLILSDLFTLLVYANHWISNYITLIFHRNIVKYSCP